MSEVVEVSPYEGAQIVIQDGDDRRLAVVAKDKGDTLSARLPDGRVVEIPWELVIDFTGFKP